MYGSTHREITAVIAKKIINFPSEYILPLCTNSESPDTIPDYEKQTYITAKGKIGTKKVRVRHHGTPYRIIRGYVLNARHYWLRDNKRKGSFRFAGRALHYIQDNFVPSPSYDKKLHDSIERGASYLNPEKFIQEENFEISIGKKETFRKIGEIKPFTDIINSLKNATKFSYIIAGSIFSSIFAPQNFNDIANKAFNKFKEKTGYILIYSIVLLLSVIVFSILKKEIGFISSIPSLVLSVMGLIIIISKDINLVLRIAQKIDIIVISSALCYIGFISYDLLTGIIQLPLFLGYYFSFFWFSNWRKIKGEVDWYIWKKD